MASSSSAGPPASRAAIAPSPRSIASRSRLHVILEELRRAIDDCRLRLRRSRHPQRRSALPHLLGLPEMPALVRGEHAEGRVEVVLHAGVKRRRQAQPIDRRARPSDRCAPAAPAAGSRSAPASRASAPPRPERTRPPSSSSSCTAARGTHCIAQPMKPLAVRPVAFQLSRPAVPDRVVESGMNRSDVMFRCVTHSPMDHCVRRGPPRPRHLGRALA